MSKISEDWGVSIGDFSQNMGPLKSPEGELLFSGDDRCPSCGALVLSDAHRSFVFFRSPEDIRATEYQEWRPSPEEDEIPGDQGPARVAYVWMGEANIQVHEGDDNGMWTPCSSYTVAREGIPYSMWICRRNHVNDPCDEEFMKDIST